MWAAFFIVTLIEKVAALKSSHFSPCPTNYNFKKGGENVPYHVIFKELYPSLY